MKTTIEELEKERDELQAKLKKVWEESADKLPPRVAKVYSDMKTKLQLKVKIVALCNENFIFDFISQKMIEELEDEVLEMRSMAVRSGAVQLKQLQDENKKLSAELSDLKSKNDDLLRDTSELIRHHSWIKNYIYFHH